MDLFGIIRLCNDLEKGLNVDLPRFLLPCNIVVLSTYIKKNQTPKNKIDGLINNTAKEYLYNIGFYNRVISGSFKYPPKKLWLYIFAFNIN